MFDRYSTARLALDVPRPIVAVLLTISVISDNGVPPGDIFGIVSRMGASKVSDISGRNMWDPTVSERFCFNSLISAGEILSARTRLTLLLGTLSPSVISCVKCLTIASTAFMYPFV